MPWFPVVGALIGGAAAATLLAAEAMHIPAILAVPLAVAIPVMLTGALHEDGLADVADGFGGGRSREDKLRILRDSRIGSFGVVALILVFALRIGSVGAMPSANSAALALIAAAALSRGVLPIVLRAVPPARADGLAVAAGRPTATQASIAVVLGCLPLMLPPWPAALVALALAAIAAATLGLIAVRQIGGHSGDVLGAIQVVTEVAVLAGIAAIVGVDR